MGSFELPKQPGDQHWHMLHDGQDVQICNFMYFIQQDAPPLLLPATSCPLFCHTLSLLLLPPEVAHAPQAGHVIVRGLLWPPGEAI